ncbi:MAG TPA: MBL fold metallo-hydrolase, partial [Longimicrobium sp.]|nr:MBL fold metallo-hydrolase [Longimicrobium sp.]
MARLTWHGHSCFTLETGDGTRIMIDPWLDENPTADIKAADVEKLDYILVSHGHFDHFADCIPLAKRTGATVISTFELVSFCEQEGVKNGHGMNIGGAYLFPFGRVKLTPAVHTGSIAG